MVLQLGGFGRAWETGPVRQFERLSSDNVVSVQ